MKISHLSGILVAFALSAHAATLGYSVVLNGSSESPANPSAGTGTASIVVDTTANTLSLTLFFSGLTSGTTASHIHCCTAAPGTGTAGVATTTPTFSGFPLGVTSGSYTTVLNLLSAASYNPAFVTANGNSLAQSEAALLAGIAAGDAYLNVHTTNFGGGEIRGFLVATPEPSTGLLLALPLAGLAWFRRRQSAR
jgi:CHRD domain